MTILIPCLRQSRRKERTACESSTGVVRHGRFENPEGCPAISD